MKIDQKYIVIGLVVITIFILYYMNKHVGSELSNNKSSRKKESFAQNAPKIINYNTTWCGHSKNLQPVWDVVIEHFSGKAVDIIDLKCDNEQNAATCKAANVPGFPTIMGIVGGKKHEYNGDRSLKSIVQWINNICGF
jgi:thiol-disulfide isomerase/thioredoxin